MADSKFISRQKPAVDELDFDALRAAGIDLVQRLAGDRWTDFNIHDPGVTILEALCYALSDLAYRSEFETADYLAESGAGIDFEALGLFRPDDVLSCDPVTVEDLRKVLLSEIPEISNLWLERSSSGSLAQALFTVHIHLRDDDVDAGAETWRRTVEVCLREVAARYRGLGEDIGAITFVDVRHFGLSGEIEVSDGSDALAIVAEIFWRAQAYVNPRPGWRSHQDAYAQDQDLEKLLRGPLTARGVLSGRELAPWRGQFSVSELIGIVAGLPGVERVNRLAFVSPSGEELQEIDLRDSSVHLVAMVKAGVGSVGDDLVVLRSGRHERHGTAEIEREIARLTIQRNEFRSRPAQFDWIRALLPRAQSRSFSVYHSMQHHFPDIYGLNAFGVPDTESPARHGQALQLKAYLLLYEQVMANYLAQLDHIPALFSLFPKTHRSYSAMALGNDDVPRVESIYPNGIDGQRRALEDLLEEFDDWVERRHRVLNRLLAMHGHDEARQLLDAIALARRLDSRQALAPKQALLAGIREFGRQRMCGGSPGDDGAGDPARSGLERNLKLLFSRGNPAEGSAGEADANTLRVVDHIQLRSVLDLAAANPPDSGFFLFRISLVLPVSFLQGFTGEAHSLINRAVRICCPAHIAVSTIVLDDARFAGFLETHERWCEALRKAGAVATASESAALIPYLRN